MNDTTPDGKKRRLLAVTVLAVAVGIGAIGAAPGTAVADHANTTDDRIQLVDAFNDSAFDGGFGSDGETVVAVQATTNGSVSELQFVHDNGTDEVGPLDLDGGVEGAAYDNGTSFGASDSFDASSGDGGIVFFELNQSWEEGPIEINASAGGTTYAAADRSNRSVLTANSYNVSLVNASGGAIAAQTPMAVSNGSTNTFSNLVLVGNGNETFHCGGVVDGGACVDPDTTGSAHTYPVGRSAFRGLVPLPAAPSVRAFDPRTANGSARTELTGTHTLTLDEPAALIEYGIFDYDDDPLAGISELRVKNRTSGNVVQRFGAGSAGGAMLLSPKTNYELVVERASGETHVRPLMIPTKGVATRLWLIDNTTGFETSEVLGVVQNESGAPVENATVTAERAGTAGFPTTINSTTTDSNGLFSMALPETGAAGLRYQFRLASARTDDGTLTYFPTRDDGNRGGYEVREGRTILPPLEIRRGGEVDIAVTNASGGVIASNNSLTSLSRTTTATSDRTRTSVVESFGAFGFQNKVKSTLIRVPSPTTGDRYNVSYNVWGLEDIAPGETPIELCANQADVARGDRTATGCELEEGGRLNVTLTQYASIIEQDASRSRARPVGDPEYYGRNVLVVRNATTGNVTTYLGPDGIQQFFTRSDETELSLPVPKGTYTVELRPTSQFIDRTSVRNATDVSVDEGGTGHAALESGRDFLIEPDFERTDRTFRRTADNTIAIRIGDRVTGELLDNTSVNASLRLVHRNGTVAGSTVPLAYNDSQDTFENTTYTPDVSAGRYLVELKATHESGNSTYNTTVREPLVVSDFATQIRTRRQTVGRNESFQARLRAFDLAGDTPEPISADSSNITLTIYDRNGNALGSGSSDTGLSDGRGTIELPAINETGVYRIGVLVEADDGRQGVDDTWIRISEYDVEVSLDRSVYAPGDTVEASVTLTDAAGDPIPDATVETSVGSENGTVSVTNATDGDGEATVTLDPASLFESTDRWSGSTFAEIEASIATDDGVDRVRTGTGIRVRPFQADAAAARGQYERGETPVIEVYVPPGTAIQSVNATEINGRALDPEVEGAKRADGFYRITLDSDLTTYGVRPQGGYRVRIEATNGNGRTVTDRARFTVSGVEVRAEPTARSYGTDENVTVNAEVRYLNGTAADGEAVSMELYEGGSDPVRVDENTTQTDGDGATTAELSPESNGVHAVVVSAGGSERSFPVLVNNLTTNFTDGSNAVDSYEFTPGQSDATINVSAEDEDGTGIDGQLFARALIDGRPVELGGSEVVDGEAGVSFSIPQSADTGTYPVEVFVQSDAGVFDSAVGEIELTADDDTVTIETVEAKGDVYAPGSSAEIRAVVTEGDDPLGGETVEFALLSEGVERSLGSDTTGADGTATINATIPSDLTNGEYGVRATVPDEGKNAFDGIFLSDIELSVDTNASAYAAGETVTVNLTATDGGEPVSDASGGVRVRLAGGGTVTESFDGAGETSPYEVDIELPEGASIVGSRTVEAFVRNGSSVAVGSTVIDVFNASESAALSVPETIVANETDFTVTANATVDTAATLTVFSPGTGSVAHEAALDLNESTSLSLSEPGTYVFRLSVPGVGTETAVRNVDTGPGDPEVRVGPDLTTNATTFDATEEIVIRTESAGMTAEVFGPEASFTVPLNREDGGTYFGTLSQERPATPYLVRLDGPNATDVDSVLIEVSD